MLFYQNLKKLQHKLAFSTNFIKKMLIFSSLYAFRRYHSVIYYILALSVAAYGIRNPVSVYGIFRQYRISETFPHTPRHKPDLWWSKGKPLGRRSLLPVPGRKPVTGHRRSRKTGRGRSLNQVELLITSFSALISSILDTKKACLATARFYKMYQCQYRCEVDSNTCIYAGEFSCSQNSGNTILPVWPLLRLPLIRF